MTRQVFTTLRNGLPQPMRVVIEPWATEHWLSSGEMCEVRAIHPTQEAQLELEITEYGAIFTVEGEGSTYEYWHNGAFVE